MPPLLPSHFGLPTCKRSHPHEHRSTLCHLSTVAPCHASFANVPCDTDFVSICVTISFAADAQINLSTDTQGHKVDSHPSCPILRSVPMTAPLWPNGEACMLFFFSDIQVDDAALRASQPPPKAGPFRAATTVLGEASIVSSARAPLRARRAVVQGVPRPTLL